MAQVLADAGVVMPSSDVDMGPSSTPARARSSDAQGAEQSRDTIDRAPRNDVRREERSQSQAAVQDRQTDRNPFDKLRRTDVDAPAHELGESLDVDAEVDFRPKSLGKIAVLGRHASKPLMLKSFTKVLEGTMLVADDSQGAAARKEGLGRDEMRQHVSRLVVSASKTQGEKRLSRIQESLRQMRFGSDPHTFVQRVMRESYAIGNEVMRDYAERMQRTNELRKEVRAEASRTREAITRNAGKEDDEPLDVPFDMMDVDHASQQLNEAFYSVQEAEDIAAQTAAANNEEGEELPPWERESQLTEGERQSLRNWADDKDAAKENLEKIIEYLPRASDAEVKDLFGPILNELADDRKEDEYLEVLSALEPRQFFLALSTVDVQIGGDHRHQLKDLRNAHLDRLSDEVGIDFHTVYDHNEDDAPHAQDDGRADYFRDKDRAVLSELDRHWESLKEDPPAHTDPARYEAGNRKQAQTVKELQDYEKYLEDQMNSIGDDAQLQNVELQNQLQRQQQLLQMMSNMSKAMHDAAMGIVRNFGG